jgi:formiminotetrahydrofolate cyclodeaminase
LGTLTDLTLGAFDDEVASVSPAPGGGSAAALAGSIGAALVAMVCRLSLDRDDVVSTDEELSTALEESERLRGRLLELVDEDTAAFNALMEALRMPKADDAQRSARAAALTAAKLGAAVPPFETLTAARQTLTLAASLAGRSNANVASDLGVAVQLGRAAAEGALLNVAINLSTLPPGPDVDRYRQESQAEIAAARDFATAAASTIERLLGLD